MTSPCSRIVSIPEFGSHLVPDFRRFWASYDLDLNFSSCTLADQLGKEVEGDYWAYRNENVDLPENAYLKRLLGIVSIDDWRRFYYGDVFTVKFTEDPETFAYTIENIQRACTP